MDWTTFFHMALVAAGLTAFEIISGVDNAVAGSALLATIQSRKAKIAFYWIGGVFAVVVVRGALPFVIFWTANADLTMVEAWNAMWSGDASVKEAVEKSAPILLAGGGIFLIMLSLHWLFVEEKKHFGFALLEGRCLAIGESWFHAIAFATIALIAFLVKRNLEPVIALNVVLAITTGGLMFFITQGFKDNAERAEQSMIHGQGTQKSDWAKVIFLVILDMTFSIDSVVGAFAFTMVVGLILIGNGIGALVVLYLTVHNVERIQSYVYLKTGAMYSIGVLGLVMIVEVFGYHIPEYVSPTVTFAFIGFFLAKSIRHNRTSVAAQAV